MNDDGNGQEYLCALRVAATRQSADAQKALPQSARSRCVRPSSLTQGPSSLLATAKWNEVFLFEVSHQVVPSTGAKVRTFQLSVLARIPIAALAVQPNKDIDWEVMVVVEIH